MQKVRGFVVCSTQGMCCQKKRLPGDLGGKSAVFEHFYFHKPKCYLAGSGDVGKGRLCRNTYEVEKQQLRESE